MKKIIYSLLFIIGSYSSYAQSVAVNTSGAAADASAMMDVSSTSKGILIPRMTTAQRTAIASPANGLLVFDTDTKGFWYYASSTWNEIPKTSGSGGSPTGPALGDLSGTYPSPNVVKIQNLDVAFGVPFDKQVMKWDMLNNKWQGMNDSLSLPFNASFGSSSSLFGITNTNTSNGAAAIYGKSGTGSGINPAFTMGVRGDNNSGAGVVGTSASGIGTYGFSSQNHGVYGYGVHNSFAGVYGTHANNGAGVMGEISNSAANGATAVYGKIGTGAGLTHSETAGVWGDNNASIGLMGTSKTGIAVYGNSLGNYGVSGTTNASGYAGVYGSGFTGAYGVYGQSGGTGGAAIYGNAGNGSYAGLFRHPNSQSTDTAVKIENSGSGVGAFINMNGAFAKEALLINQNAGTHALKINSSTTPSVIDINGTSTISLNPVININAAGKGEGINVSMSNAGNDSNAVKIYTAGTGNGIQAKSKSGKAAHFIIDNPTNTNEVVNISNTSNGDGLHVSTSGIIGTISSAAGQNGIGVKGESLTANGGTGVLGTANANDPTGIGVKGVAGGGISGGAGVWGEGKSANPNAIGVKGTSYTNNETVGAVTGINMATGVGVYGEGTGLDGIGVVGVVGNTTNSAVAAMFKNNYSNNTRSVVEVKSNGKGNSIYTENTNLTNTAPQLRMVNAGTGQFLRFEDNLGGIVTTVAKNGNISTDGTVTVKNNKGIVRSSTSTQMRFESIQAVLENIGGLPIGICGNCQVTRTISFPTPFSNPPAVALGDLLPGGLSSNLVILRISNVTTTGCEITIENKISSAINFKGTYNLIAIGPE